MSAAPPQCSFWRASSTGKAIADAVHGVPAHFGLVEASRGRRAGSGSAGSNRLVVVSNRVARQNEVRAGGLAAAMRAALMENGGLWFGWSGNLVAEDRRQLHHESDGAIDYALLDLTQEEYQAYYLGFSNRSLWPLLHFQPTRMQYSHAEYAGYRRVNQLFAQKLASLLRPADRIWVQDYHLIPLASELRALGIRARMGFFLHVPLPPPQLLADLPCHADLMRTLLAYDLVGVQTAANATSLRRYFLDVAGASCTGDTVTQDGRQTRIAPFPISIDTALVARQAEAAMNRSAFRGLRASVNGHKLVIGVDRLDYSKGISQRLQAFDRFLAQHRPWRKKVSLLQVAPISRKEVPEYHELRLEVERIVGAINGHHARPDWLPIRYVNHSFARATLTGFYRMARVALVTPLRDGMNLVAKEFVAAQDPADPGVLVLSRFAGAAQELQQALLVNPYDPDDLVDALVQGLEMPLAERRARWQAMFECISAHDVGAWRKAFLSALERCGLPHQHRVPRTVLSMAEIRLGPAATCAVPSCAVANEETAD
ncbi:MAG: trehalose-6-phosphate synthase [Ottowia sp.]|nr:trehalose-6-phosphate synthase [Ottowia sp.]